MGMARRRRSYVDNWLETRQSVNDIISAFTVFVLSTNLGESLQADGDQIFKRAELFNLLRSNKGLMLVDKETEEFQNVSASLSGLDMLQAQAQEHTASVSHIPLVKLLGTQPAGLHASSEGEMRSFNDYVHSFQEHLFRQPLHRLLGLMMISLWGAPDDGIDFEFEKLEETDEKEAADVEKTKAERDQILIDTGVISPEESRSASRPIRTRISPRSTSTTCPISSTKKRTAWCRRAARRVARKPRTPHENRSQLGTVTGLPV